MAETEPMNWSPLQCVITDANLKIQDVGEGGSEGNEGGKAKVVLRGYGLGLKGRSPVYFELALGKSVVLIQCLRRSPARSRHHVLGASFQCAL